MPIYSVEFAAMASRCEIRLAADDESAARALAQAAADEVRRIEAKYSRYRDDSVVSRINAGAGRAWVDCDDETLQLLHYADSLYAQSHGLFDITSGILRRAWDFRQPRLPDPQHLRALCALIGWQRVRRDGARLMLPDAGMEIDFGGFGKEYAADRAAATLRAAGLHHALVSLGGDVSLAGPRPDGSTWSIGVRDPRDPARTFASLQLTAGGLATSGDYERYFELDGRRYCHVLDPRSGWPVSHWRSVSVAAPSCLVAGSLATMTMLMQAGGATMLRGTGLPFLAIDHEGRVHRNEG